jgi:hypothetical protein
MRPGMIRASVIGPWHFGHGSLSTAIRGIVAVSSESAIGIPPLDQAGAQSSEAPVDTERGRGDRIIMLFELPEWLVNIAHIRHLLSGAPGLVVRTFDLHIQGNATTGGLSMSLTQFSVDDGPHNMDGLRLFAQDGSQRVEAFIGRKVMDVWADSHEQRGGRQSLFRGQYDALGKLNLAAIERIVNAKYQRGAAFNRQHPFVEVLVSDIAESGEALDLTELVREPLPPTFHRLT